MLSDEQRRLIDADREQYIKLYGDPINTFAGSKETDDEFNSLLVMQKRFRPDWDLANLPAYGYTNVRAVPRVNEMVYAPSKALIYNNVPLFMVMADRPN